jgi:hypothetical protein
MGKMLVFTNAVDGRDDEFNRWYDEVHLPEVLALDAFTGATRHRVTDAQMYPDQSHRYLAIYEFEGDPQDAIDQMIKAAGDMDMSDTMVDPHLVIVDDIGA